MTKYGAAKNETQGKRNVFLYNNFIYTRQLTILKKLEIQKKPNLHSANV